MLHESIERDGYALLEDAANTDQLCALRKITNSPEPSVAHRRGGIRNAFDIFPDLWEIYHQTIAHQSVCEQFGAIETPTRAILFDKTPDSNWSVEWHQDTSVAVAEQIPTPGFGPWSVKDGIAHVRPPASVLRLMITVRLHIDDCPSENGPLVVVSGSHDHGFIERADLPDAEQPVTLPARAGDAVLMCPLILHASQKATSPTRRRILHVEYATAHLPAPLAWHAAA